MRRAEALHRIAQSEAALRSMDVAELSLFGSVARDDATEASDVDLLVEFSRPVGLLHFVRVRRFLESILEAKVDLVTRDAIKRQLREAILSEAVRAA